MTSCRLSGSTKLKKTMPGTSLCVECSDGNIVEVDQDIAIAMSGLMRKHFGGITLKH
jgi:hypothetical protein